MILVWVVDGLARDADELRVSSVQFTAELTQLGKQTVDSPYHEAIRNALQPMRDSQYCLQEYMFCDLHQKRNEASGDEYYCYVVLKTYQLGKAERKKHVAISNDTIVERVHTGGSTSG